MHKCTLYTFICIFVHKVYILYRASCPLPYWVRLCKRSCELMCLLDFGSRWFFFYVVHFRLWHVWAPLNDTAPCSYLQAEQFLVCIRDVGDSSTHLDINFSNLRSYTPFVLHLRCLIRFRSIDIPLSNMCTVCTHHSVNVDNGRVKCIVSSFFKVTYFVFSLSKYLKIPNHIITIENAYPGFNPPRWF